MPGSMDCAAARCTPVAATAIRSEMQTAMMRRIRTSLVRRRLLRAPTRNIPSPSADPRSGSTARSGCGIMPRTFPSALTIPAMSRIEPLGLASGSGSPRASTYRNTTRPSASSLSSVVRVGDVPPFAVRDRKPENLARLVPMREQRVRVLHAQTNRCRHELQAAVAHQRARQQAAPHTAIWNPLQMPSTGPPRRACAATSCMIGLKRAIAPARR